MMLPAPNVWRSMKPPLKRSIVSRAYATQNARLIDAIVAQADAESSRPTGNPDEATGFATHVLLILGATAALTVYHLIWHARHGNV